MHIACNMRQLNLHGNALSSVTSHPCLEIRMHGLSSDLLHRVMTLMRFTGPSVSLDDEVVVVCQPRVSQSILSLTGLSRLSCMVSLHVAKQEFVSEVLPLINALARKDADDWSRLT